MINLSHSLPIELSDLDTYRPSDYPFTMNPLVFLKYCEKQRNLRQFKPLNLKQ